ncbi:conserved hypothetical protein [Paenibacillus curdlanolyticus YK9]|uniref:Motility protein n=1 Tax=Paenibacillus curdlanolyticus YK9 TaxID=717606 RepID=E0I6P0_9BACL|nr:YjfB family protein [Paenibacillus curdlanolyticus]EFM11706.1 conserved hypothetical protein [Paenibacillus curdlanolyticus YK9]
MDIAALSTAMSRSALSQSVGISLLGKAMSQAETQAQGIVQMMQQQSVQPHLGGQLDIRIL